MKASELRIGNYVSSPSSSEIGGIWTVSAEDIASQEEAITYGRIHLSPIPLTEEWLIKFGFDKYAKSETTGNEYYRFHPLTDYLSGDGRFEIWSGKPSVFCIGDDKGCFTNSISYVHQLQNLYFCLTGEELTIK